MAPSLALLLPSWCILIILYLQLQSLSAEEVHVANTIEELKYPPIAAATDEEPAKLTISSPVKGTTYWYDSRGLIIQYDLYIENREEDPPCTFQHSIAIAQNDDVHLLAQFLCFHRGFEYDEYGAVDEKAKDECLSKHAHYFENERRKQRDVTKSFGLEARHELLEVRVVAMFVCVFLIAR
jgi:hypothetical protein